MFYPIIVDSIVLADFEIGAPAASSEDSPENGEAKRNVRPIHLTEEARNRFIAIYETRLNDQVYYPPLDQTTTYRRILELQAYQMGRAILGETETYTPFIVR